MIVVRLCGGLGNQLFQYAAARRLAHAHGARLVLDLHWYSHTPAIDTPRAYELARYPIAARVANRVEGAFCLLHGARLTRRLPMLPRRWRHYRERDGTFDSAVLELPDNVYLDGYWQSPKYFEDIPHLVRAELTPTVDLGEYDKKVADLICARESVAVHVRRGDYVTNQAAAAMHGVCSLDYYNRALAQILALVPDPRFFVFSDDTEWTRQNLRLPGPATYVDHNGADAAFQDLRLMAMCRHQITANSSFSWWGAWLNPNPAKTVIVPEKWFSGRSGSEALIPSQWFKI